MKTFKQFKEAMDLSFISGAKQRPSVADQKEIRDKKIKASMKINPTGNAGSPNATTKPFPMSNRFD
jgi:hypothetical protein